MVERFRQCNVELRALNGCVFLWDCCRGATNYQEWFEFLGLVKDRRQPPTGSPFQITFPSRDPPEGMQGLTDDLPSCASPPLTCSCGDCPVAPGCEPVSTLLSVSLILYMYMCVGPSLHHAV